MIVWLSAAISMASGGQLERAPFGTSILVSMASGRYFNEGMLMLLPRYGLTFGRDGVHPVEVSFGGSINEN